MLLVNQIGTKLDELIRQEKHQSNSKWIPNLSMPAHEMDYIFLGSKLTCSISYWSTQRGCWATSPARRRPSGLLRRRPATSKSGSRNSGGRGRGQEAAAGADADLEEDAVWGPGGWRSTRWALGEGRGGEGREADAVAPGRRTPGGEAAALSSRGHAAGDRVRLRGDWRLLLLLLGWGMALG